jgi:hypothetical protein
MLAFMDRSTLRLPDPDAPLPNRERRRTVRQRLHTPIYVSFNTPQSGAVVDLSELVDLNENGFAVQTAIPSALSTAQRLEVNRAVTLCLDLPETRQFVHGSGQVMWTDDTGRAGIRFSFLPERSRQVLKEWLFANLLVASTNHAARVNQLVQRRQESGAPELTTQADRAPEHGASEQRASDPAPLPMADSQQTSLQTQEQIESTSPLTDRAELLSALDDVRRQIREIQDREIQSSGTQGRESQGPEVEAREDAVLQLITERAASLTGASGAALALLTRNKNEGKVICRARVGEPAPPVSSEVDVKTGLSGECLREGMIVSCGDTESDPRVDPEICRLLGIGSFMAAPIFADFRVVGLIEILSPYARTFTKAHEVILERLAELVPRVESDKVDSDKEDKGRIEQRKIEEARAEFELPKAERTSAGPMIQQPPAQTRPEQTRPEQTKRQSAGPEPAIAHHSAAEPNAIEEQSSQQERAPEHSLDGLAEYGRTSYGRTSAGRLPFSHLVLLVLTVAVAAMAVGYLLAPTIEQHWLRPAQAAQNASGPPVAVDRRGHALSPTELRKLADQGDADAQWQLGILYHEGETVPKDDAMAVQWFERAAEQGYVSAQTTLGAYYEAGRGVTQDFSKAYFWSVLALAQGDDTSKLRLQDLAARMTPSQVASARQQAEAWLHAHSQPANAKPN